MGAGAGAGARAREYLAEDDALRRVIKEDLPWAEELLSRAQRCLGAELRIRDSWIILEVWV